MSDGRVTINDAIEGAAFLQQYLGTIAPKVYERKFPEFKSRVLFAPAPGTGPEDEWYAYQITDQQGRAKFLNHQSDDLPYIAVSGGSITHNLHEIGTVVKYSVHELGLAGRTGNFNIVQSRINAERRAHLTLHDRASWIGDTTFGVWGFMTHPSVPRLIAANAFDGSSTGDQILAVMNLAMERQAVLTNNVERANTLVMSSGPLSYIASTPRSAVSDKTIMAYFREAHPQIDQVEPIHWLDAAGTNSGDVMGLYNRDADNLQRLDTMQPVALTPQAKNLMVYVPMRSRHGGIAMPYPLSAIITEGI